MEEAIAGLTVFLERMRSVPAGKTFGRGQRVEILFRPIMPEASLRLWEAQAPKSGSRIADAPTHSGSPHVDKSPRGGRRESEHRDP